MLQPRPNSSAESDPSGSIFLFEPLSESGYQRLRLAMLMGRGAFRDMDVQDIEDHDRELKLRLALTQKHQQGVVA